MTKVVELVYECRSCKKEFRDILAFNDPDNGGNQTWQQFLLSHKITTHSCIKKKSTGIGDIISGRYLS